MKTIKRYTIQNEEGTAYASYLSSDEAFMWLEIANRGQMIRQGWAGKNFHIVEQTVNIVENTGTLFFR